MVIVVCCLVLAVWYANDLSIDACAHKWERETTNLLEVRVEKFEDAEYLEACNGRPAPKGEVEDGEELRDEVGNVDLAIRGFEF